MLSGETNLSVLLQSMQPELKEGIYVFCTVPLKKAQKIKETEPILIFQEKEGTTLVVIKEQAIKASFAFQGEWSLITLNIHSSLEAVGFLAKITAGLARAGISVNAVSAFYHDHLFVPTNRAAEAMKVLAAMR